MVKTREFYPESEVVMPISPEAEGAYVAFDALPEHEQRLLVAQVLETNPGWLPESEANKARLWLILLIGLFSIAIACVIAAVILILNGSDSAPALVIVTAVVAGVIGLFSKSPTA